MPIRTISLYPGRSVTLSTYLAAWRQVKADEPARMYSRGPGCWWPMSAAEILKEMRYGIMDRINRHIPGYGVGRKWSSDWQRAALQTAIQVNTPRRRVYWVPKDLKSRLDHRLSCHAD